MNVYSFDIFDTCLTRIYARPTDLFIDLAPTFLNRYCQHGYDTHAHALFVYARKRAEREVRNLNKEACEDITLLSVYRHLKTLLPWNFDIEEAMSLELLLEKQSLKPVLPIRSFIDQLREEQHRIVFISDMYLPTEFIKMCLIEHGIAKRDDNVYVSGDIGLSKHRGSLFKYVLSTEQINATDLIHYGDNWHADVKVPLSLGIQSQCFKNIQLTQCENDIVSSKQNSLIDTALLSKLVAQGRYVRISNLTGLNTKNKNNLTTDVIAPLLTSYVAWVFRTANLEGIKRLYFVSRDGQILFRIAQELNKYISAPECRYLYGSRQAWFLPSVTKCNEDNLRWLITPGRSNSVRSIFAKLDIEPDSISDLLIQAGLDVIDYDRHLVDAELAHFKQILFGSSKIAKCIEDKAFNARGLLKQYLEQEQLNDGTSWALVDVGWRLNCQQALKRVIEALAWQCDVKGYYLALASDHLPIAEAGNFRAYMSNTQNHISRRGLLIENVFTPADHPTVVGYRKELRLIEPIFKLVDQCQKLMDYTYNLHQVCCEYARETGKAGIWNEHDALIDHAIQKNTLRLLKFPSLDEVSAINWIPIVHDQLHNQDDFQILAQKVRFKNVIELVQFEFGLCKTRPNYYWLEGCAAMSSFTLRNLLFFLLFVKNNWQSFFR